jgi:cbb3-type cytochrome oxidase cytochrome c subunit
MRFFKRASTGLSSTAVAIMGCLTERASAAELEVLSGELNPAYTAITIGTVALFVLAGCIYCCSQMLRQDAFIEDEESAAIRARTSVREADEVAGFFP